MSVTILVASSLAVLFCGIAAHSMMSEPQSTSPNVCRIGGDPNPGNCPGPCDMKAVEGRFSNFDSPSNPAARYSRGQNVRIKYQRNNHGPGGFVRHTLVPVKQMMSKAAHKRNAFHYSCFGARPEKATASDKLKDRWGYSIIGNDGMKAPPAYYVTTITIPDVVPDGDYVLGWLWFGGTGGHVSNKWPYKEQLSSEKSYFTDYWSCAFVRVEGGDPLMPLYTPIFVNDMSKFSDEGCMSGNDAPGVCTFEPCLGEAAYQKPRPFRNGSFPDPITPANFGPSSIGFREGLLDSPPYQLPPEHPPLPGPDDNGKREDPENSPEDMLEQENPENSPEEILEEGDADGKRPTRNHQLLLQKRSCRCIGLGTKCGRSIARSDGYCEAKTAASDQPRRCIRACCDLCRQWPKYAQSVCRDRDVRTACRL